MTTTLTGEVGQTGRTEDAAMVQGLLANVKGPDGRPFWDRRIDGRPGTELTLAIAAFQKAYEPTVIKQPSDRGTVRPGLTTWNALVALFPRRLGALGVSPGTPPVLYAAKNPGAVAGETASRLRRGVTAPEQRVARRLRPELARAVEAVAASPGVGLILGGTALVGDRIEVSFVPVGLSVLDGNGRPQSVDGRPRDVPAGLWREIDRAITAAAAVDATGSGGYRPRDGLSALREPLPDPALAARLGVDASTIRGDRRPALAALAVIARARQLSPVDQDELTQLIDIVAAEDLGTARALEHLRRRHSVAGTATDGPPSPFERAADQLLRTIRRNYQSPPFARLKSLTAHATDHILALREFAKLVDTGGPWDIKREFPRWVADPVEGVEYGSDLWGNLHYGYIGKAAGIFQGELWAGAQWQAVRSTGRLDDPKDQAAIWLGTTLWNEHRFPIPRTALLEALRWQKAVVNTR